MGGLSPVILGTIGFFCHHVAGPCAQGHLMTIAIKTFTGLSHGVSLQLLCLMSRTLVLQGLLVAGTQIFNWRPSFDEWLDC